MKNSCNRSNTNNEAKLKIEIEGVKRFPNFDVEKISKSIRLLGKSK